MAFTLLAKPAQVNRQRMLNIRQSSAVGMLKLEPSVCLAAFQTVLYVTYPGWKPPQDGQAVKKLLTKTLEAAKANYNSVFHT